MTTTFLRRSLALVAATAFAVLSAGTSASANPTDPVITPAPQAKAGFVLTLSPTSTVSFVSQYARVTLTCSPDGGTHSSPEKACDALREVDGYFERLRPLPGAYCPAVWDPVKATARGYWGDRRVSFEKTYGNACEAGVATSGVFFL